MVNAGRREMRWAPGIALRGAERLGSIPMDGSRLKSNVLLTVTALIWGFAFSAQRSGMESLGPFAYNAARFALGALSVLPLFVMSRRRRGAGLGSGLKTCR